MNLQRILRIVSVVLFLLVGVGIGTLGIGTVSLSLLGFGLACFAASHL